MKSFYQFALTRWATTKGPERQCWHELCLTIEKGWPNIAPVVVVS